MLNLMIAEYSVIQLIGLAEELLSLVLPLGIIKWTCPSYLNNQQIEVPSAQGE